jgi:hypothetical protein
MIFGFLLMTNILRSGMMKFNCGTKNAWAGFEK